MKFQAAPTLLPISRAVDDLRPALVAFLQDLVRSPSLPNNEGPVQAQIAAKLRSLGLEVEMLTTRFDELAGHPAFDDDGFSPDSRVNVVGRWPGSGEGKGRGSLLLNGHVDVVSPGVLYGPDDVRQAHTANESVAIAEVVAAVKTIAGMVTNWCG